jgi:hypothetical protein
VKNSKALFIICALFFSFLAYAQLKTLKGKVVADDEVEGIHILNKTALKYTTTNADGSFEVLAKVFDTLIISALKYQLKEVIVTTDILNLGYIHISLEEKINILDQVVVGTILTGNLNSDINNLDVKTDINFYDLGISGYTGGMPTLGERKLIEATSGGGLISLNTLLNAITGRTKYLKSIVELEKKEKCLNKLKDPFSGSIFAAEKMADSLKLQYFDYSADDSSFKTICSGKATMTQLEFLLKKLKDFKIHIKSKDED